MNPLRERRRVQLKFSEPSRTKQAFKNECDINQILAKYQKTQMLTHVNSHQGNYGDFSNATDYQTALNSVMAANEAFMGLSSTIRSRFNNNPASFIDFISDDQNYDEAFKLGILDPVKSQIYLESKKPKSSTSSKDSSNKPLNDD